MATMQNFRSSVGGFNRQDVVQYIEYMNNKHKSQVEQLNTQLQVMQAELNKARAAAQAHDDLLAKLEAAEARCAQLETELAQVPEAAPAQELPTADELEAYRRAERTERIAQERAAQIYAQANAVLADATAKADAAAAQISDLTMQVCAQLQSYQTTINSNKALLQDTAVALAAIRPEE